MFDLVVACIVTSHFRSTFYILELHRSIKSDDLFFESCVDSHLPFFKTGYSSWWNSTCVGRCFRKKSKQLVVVSTVCQNWFVFIWCIKIWGWLATVVLALRMKIHAIAFVVPWFTTYSMPPVTWTRRHDHAFVVCVMAELALGFEAFPSVECSVVILIISHFYKWRVVIPSDLFSILGHLPVGDCYNLLAVLTLKTYFLFPTF